MNLNNKYTKFFTFVLASGVLASSAFAGPCGGSKNKPEKIAKYKTPQMVVFVNSTIDYLNSKEDSNQRHLKVLKNCQKTFNSGKNSAKGMEAKNLKACKNIMNNGEYEVQKIAVKLTEDRIKSNTSKPVALKKETKNETKKINQTIDSTNRSDSDLLLF